MGEMVLKPDNEIDGKKGGKRSSVKTDGKKDDENRRKDSRDERGREKTYMMALRIGFVVLLCLPLLFLAVNLLGKLFDEYIRINEAKQEQKKRKAFAEQRSRMRDRGRK